MLFRELFVWWGGGRNLLARKIIYRKIIFHQNHMLTTFEAKRSRWVYEGGELERDSKSLRAVMVCLGITIMVLRGLMA
jgi:hypothetical protein